MPQVVLLIQYKSSPISALHFCHVELRAQKPILKSYPSELKTLETTCERSDWISVSYKKMSQRGSVSKPTH